MNLERTKQLIHGKINREDPIASLIHILESAIELVSLPDNDFCWSRWKGADEAIAEIDSIKNRLKNGCLNNCLPISSLFEPTGPLQEVSLSSGWGDAFLKVAEKYDEVEKLL